MWWLLLPGASGAAPASLDLAEVWREESGLNGALFGNSVASAGDVDGDGYDDIVLGALNYTGTLQRQGRAYVYLGSPRGPGQTAAWTEDGARVGASFGCSVASAGDVNGDGFDDVIVGAYGDTSAGRAYVYLGSAAGLASAPVWTGTQPLPPDPAIGSFGFDVSSAGDVNGDGFDDILVGDPHDGPTADDGKAFVYLGSAAGPDTDPVWTAPGETLAGLGYAVAAAGDVNGDGFDDILVGATWSQTAYVFHGSASGPEASASWTGVPEQPGDYVLEVTSAGDVDGDGYDDVVVGVPYELTPAGTLGRVYVFHGGPTGLGDAASWIVDAESNMREFGVSVAAAGDVDRDGYDDLLVGAGEDTNAPTVRPRVLLYRGSASGMVDMPAWTVASGGVRGSLGMSVASAGDTDGDGYADVIAGAPRFENASGMTGQASVYLGSCQLGSDLDADGVGDVCDRCAGFDDRLDTDADGLPNGCDGCPGGFDAVDPDLDADGFCATVDCDDHDPTVFPGAIEACNGRDDDCDGLTPEDETDDDLDRVLACAGDCDDRDGFTYPGAPQRCDRVDNTCAGVVSSDEIDADNDGYWGCAGDCDDGDPAVNLSADEVCGNGVDDNCDGVVDESCGCGCNGAAGFGSAGAVLLAGMLAVTRRKRAVC